MGRIASKKLVRSCILFAVLLSAAGLSGGSAAAVPLKQGQIAYLRNGDIYLFDLAANQTTTLTRGGDIGNFAWFPLSATSGSEPAIPGMPIAGQAQANDLLAWGALAACIAIAAGLVLISRRRRKDRDGL